MKEVNPFPFLLLGLPESRTRQSESFSSSSSSSSTSYYHSQKHAFRFQVLSHSIHSQSHGHWSNLGLIWARKKQDFSYFSPFLESILTYQKQRRVCNREFSESAIFKWDTLEMVHIVILSGLSEKDWASLMAICEALWSNAGSFSALALCVSFLDLLWKLPNTKKMARTRSLDEGNYIVWLMLLQPHWCKMLIDQEICYISLC